MNLTVGELRQVFSSALTPVLNRLEEQETQIRALKAKHAKAFELLRQPVEPPREPHNGGDPERRRNIY